MTESAPESEPQTSDEPTQPPVLEEKSLVKEEQVLQKTALDPGKKSVLSSSLVKTAKAKRMPGLVDEQGKKLDFQRAPSLFDTWVKEGYIKLPNQDPVTRTAWRGLFVKVASAAALSTSKTYERADVIMAFGILLDEADKRETNNRKTYEWLTTKLTADAQLRSEIESLAEKVLQQMGKDGTGTIVEAKLPIFRGTSPFQAEKIYTQKSMGGEVANPGRTQRPSEAEAVNQTGLNDKKAQHGTIEEWSLAPQWGFATGGFMMAALVNIDHVRIPKPGPSRLRGERGVTGYGDLPVEPIVLAKGRDSVTPSVQAKIDDIGKREEIAKALDRALGGRPPSD
ncbi:hypothetical protein [Streptomyces sp. NPDC127119]|uniref:hypothetical protein n=1 Tax=Streptomyces sp. NPDC127119 TaxID=3345370 RepID=UPI003637B804